MRAVGVDIDVDKRIPMGGGLGGGSSDAASRAARAQSAVGRRLAARPRSLQIGLALGADVPFFLVRRAGVRARCRRACSTPVIAAAHAGSRVVVPPIAIVDRRDFRGAGIDTQRRRRRK